MINRWAVEPKGIHLQDNLSSRDPWLPLLTLSFLTMVGIVGKTLIFFCCCRWMHILFYAFLFVSILITTLYSYIMLREKSTMWKMNINLLNQRLCLNPHRQVLGLKCEKNLWNLTIPSKWKIFMWQSCLEILPNCANLVQHKIVDLDTYFLCHRSVGTTIHVLWQFKGSRRIWTNRLLATAYLIKAALIWIICFAEPVIYWS